MDAVRAHAFAHGARRAPVVSPAHELLADGDPATGVASRIAPPAGSGLTPTSSKIFDVARLHAAGYAVVPYTVDDPSRMEALLRLGVDGLVSDRPDVLHDAVARFDADGDGRPGDLLLPDGRVDPLRFDAQAHRGGRGLRPENTLPAMEAGLDALVTTLETDVGLTKDGVAVLFHDPYVPARTCRRADGAPYAAGDEVLIRDLTLAELQSRFVCDRTFRGPQQRNDPELSPVTQAFAAAHGRSHAYAPATVQELFDLARFYAEWYAGGPGRDDPKAAVRAANARAVRFNIECKTNPRTDRDERGRVLADRTVGFAQFADTIGGLIERNGLAGRADVQAFDFRTLLRIHERHPAIRTVFLFGDFPRYADPSVPGSGDGANLQPQGDEAGTRWLCGLDWPYRY